MLCCRWACIKSVERAVEKVIRSYRQVSVAVCVSACVCVSVCVCVCLCPCLCLCVCLSVLVMPAVAEWLRRAYPALLEWDGVGSIPANSDAQNVPSFRRWRFEMKLSPPTSS